MVCGCECGCLVAADECIEGCVWVEIEDRNCWRHSESVAPETSLSVLSSETEP